MTMKTNLTKKIASLPLLIAAGVLVVSGCSYPGAEQDREAYAQSKGQSTAEPVEEETAAPESQPSEDDEAEPSDGGGEDTEADQPSDGGGESEGESPAPKVEKIDLSPESETAVVYLRAIQNFSPELEVWTVDEEAGMVEYRRYNCLGSAQGIGVGTFAPREGGDEGEYLITWEGENPGPAGNGDSQEEWATMTERTLEVDRNVSSTHYDIEFERFGGMCKSTGESVAGFVL